MEHYPDTMMLNVEQLRAEQKSWSSIAAIYSQHEEQIRSAFRRWKKRNKRTMWDGVIPEDLRPYELTFELPKVTVDATPWKGRDIWHQLVFGDLHVPYHDEVAYAILLQIIEDHQPDHIVTSETW